MAPPLLLLQDIRLTLGAAPLLDGAELAVGAGDRIGLVGRNGSGKTTLLRVAAGELAPDGGTRFLQPGTTIGVLPQEPDLSAHATTLAYAAAGLDETGAAHARALLHELGLTGDEPAATVSGGEARRAALARTLAGHPDLLLLDEPTNHLDLPAIEWLERELAGLRAGLVLISHDRRFLERLTRSTVWLDRGRTRRLERGFDAFETWRDEQLAQEEQERHKLDRQIVREEDWMRYGVTGRRKRNVRRVAELAGLRAQRRDTVRAPGDARMEASQAELSGKLVVVAEGVTKSYGDRPIVRRLDLRVLRRDRLGIVGPNGAGKTTLLRLLTGALPPDQGTVKLGANLAIVTLDQQRASLDPAATLSDTLTGGGGDQVEVAGEKRHVIGYMKDFLFLPEQARTPVASLSGGERGRLALACALARPANLLVLDEPTNDLDLETLDLLQEVLADHPGTVLLVSHDRDFLDRVATSTLAAEDGGRWVEYAGGYSDMLAQRGPPPSPAKLSPKADSRKGAKPPNAADRRPSAAFSGKQRHELSSLPLAIEAARARMASAQGLLEDSGLYARDAAAFRKTSEALVAAQETLAALEDRWLELELQREEAEAR